MNLSNLIFSWLLGVGIVVPMNDTSDNRQLYTLYVIDHKEVQMYAYYQAYEEEIIEWIESGTFEYESERESSENLENQIIEEENSDD